MSTPYPPPYPSGLEGPDHAAVPSYLATSPAPARLRPYSPWISAVMACVGGFGLRIVAAFFIGLVAVLGGFASGLADADLETHQLVAGFIAVSVVVNVVVALLQGRFLDGRGARRPYVAAFAAAAAGVVARLVLGVLGWDLTVLVVGPLEIVVIALLTTHRPGAATRVG